MGDDIGSGSVTGCCLRSLGDHRPQNITEPEPMSSPINYPAYLVRPRRGLRVQVGGGQGADGQPRVGLQHVLDTLQRVQDLPRVRDLSVEQQVRM